MRPRVAAAVERALEERQREATDEVERILAAAVQVIERVSPGPFRIADVLAEAGASNAAFYRYFSGKDDLMLAVLERGTWMVVSYLDHEMAKQPTQVARITRWIEGTLAQVSDPNLTRVSRAIIAHLDSIAADQVAGPMRERLLEAITAAGSTEPERDADAVFALVLGTLRRHVALETVPAPGEVEHLVSFSLRALHLEPPAVGPSRS